MAWIEIQNKEGKKLRIPKGAYDVYYKENPMFSIVPQNIEKKVSKPSSKIEEKKENIENGEVDSKVTRNYTRKSPKKDTIQ